MNFDKQVTFIISQKRKLKLCHAFLPAPLVKCTGCSKHKLFKIIAQKKEKDSEKVSSLSWLLTSISLNPEHLRLPGKYKMIFSRWSTLKMFSTETSFEAQESSAYSPSLHFLPSFLPPPPPPPSSQCFKAAIRCDSLSNLHWGFYPSRRGCSVISLAFSLRYNTESIMSTQICEKV